MNDQTSPDASNAGPSSRGRKLTPEEDIRMMREEIRRLEGVKTRFARMQINQLYIFIGQLEDESQNMPMIESQLAIDPQLNSPNTSMLANQPSPAGPILAPDTVGGVAETAPIPAQGGEEPVNIFEAAPQAPPVGGAIARRRQESEAAPRKVMEMFAEVESIDAAEVGEGTKKEISRFEAIFGHLQDLAEAMTGDKDEAAILKAPWIDWHKGHRLAEELKKQYERIIAALK